MGVEVVADGVNPWVVGVTVADGLSLKTVKDQSFGAFIASASDSGADAE